MAGGMFKLTPFVADKIWGYERWTVSTLPGGPSRAQDDGKTLAEKIGAQYPLLIKVIQANETLSVQVHPADEYAKKHENSFGKTECWYILDAEPGASLVCGLNKNYGRGELQASIEAKALEACLYSTPVSKGDFLFIPAGTVHAIQGGLRILEIQQPSDVTYRLYDWGRGRELHVEKSLDVIENAFAANLPAASLPHRAFTGPFSCPYFTVEKLDGSAAAAAVTTGGSGSCFFVLDGAGSAECGGETLALEKEDTLMVCPGRTVRFSGALSLMKIVPAAL